MCSSPHMHKDSLTLTNWYFGMSLYILMYEEYMSNHFLARYSPIKTYNFIPKFDHWMIHMWSRCYCRDHTGTCRDTLKDVGLPLMEAMQQYEEGNYEAAVNLAYPVRYNIPKLGGSDAQVHNLILFYFSLWISKWDNLIQTTMSWPLIYPFLLFHSDLFTFLICFSVMCSVCLSFKQPWNHQIQNTNNLPSKWLQ